VEQGLLAAYQWEKTMKRTFAALLFACIAAPAAMAADVKTDKAPTAQQMRMTECNQRAADKKGDERKQFMSACLSGKEPEAKMTQQERMKVCNQRAVDKKGDERKQFMSECLKG
jgi:psiF repeat